MDAATQQLLTGLYPILEVLQASERERVLTDHTRSLSIPGPATLFDQGSPCQGFPMVVSGEVRVVRGSAAGRSLELYRVTPGEICVVSASCLFGQAPVSAAGATTRPTELVLLSPQGFDRCVAHPEFRRYVFGIFADRLADLMALAEAVAFQRLDQRLAHALLGHGAALKTTHQALADELGTVREIVTRLLARFERSGWIVLGRERIDIVDGDALRRLAAGV